MKIKLLLICCFLSFYGKSQTLIKISPFSVPANAPANVSDWSSLNTLIILCTATPQANASVIEGSRVVFTIKQNGTVVCSSEQVPANFTGTTKMFKGNDIAGYLRNCSLKPGAYQLCVQFFSSINGAAPRPISEEKCSNAEFTIQPVVGKYTAPQNILPIANATITDKSSPLMMKWTPLIPRPRDPVVYKVRVWQLMEGQNGTQAMRSNTPYFEKEVNNITQLTIPNFYNGPCKPPYLCDFIWNVQAVERQGNILGTSEPTLFSIIVTDPSIGCFELDTTQYKVTCKGFTSSGQPIYSLTNLILKNIGTAPGRTGLHNTPATNYITPTGFTVASLTPASATSILPGNSINISFDIIGATGSTASFIVNSTIINASNPNLYCDKTIGVTVDLPPCICRDCEGTKVEAGNTNISVANAATGLYTAAGVFNFTGFASIYGVAIDVLSYSYVAAPASCSNGVTSVENSGVIVLSGTTINGSPVSMANETVSGLPSTNNGVAKNIKLLSTTPLPSGIPFNINFGLPTALAGLPASCCKITYTVCLRITVFTDKDKCNSCKFTYCFPAFTN